MVTTTFVFAMFVQSRNDWHHVTLVWTGYRVEMYMDGVCKDSASLSGGRLYNTLCPLVVAGEPKKRSEDVVPYMGYMDQICMYGRALSPNQVKHMYKHRHP
ncbi:hypothetical protein NP493_97g00030 [Ridgeia piscesae]|uniref:Uncharacterized protein n=1 Tax=Ridgeia piscesae TaxID=27915 RepID=A0AAD9P889_RIDPI|nr:hypothetical protein NP493_97g00030 [Ridgeia piscesae]